MTDPEAATSPKERSGSGVQVSGGTHKPLPTDVKCVLLQGFASVKQMKCISIPRPKPGDGEVLVHVKSWSVHLSEILVKLSCIWFDRRVQFQNVSFRPISSQFSDEGRVRDHLFIRGGILWVSRSFRSSMVKRFKVREFWSH